MVSNAVAAQSLIRVYRTSTGWRICLLILSVLLGLPSAAGIFHFGTGHEVKGTADIAFMVSICATFVLLTVYLVLWVLLSCVAIAGDRVESRGVFRTRTIRKDDIVGYRYIPAKYGTGNYVLVGRDAGKKLTISNVYGLDEFFFEWLKEIPSLDEQQARDSKREILADERYGLTPNDRLESFHQTKRLERILKFGTIVVLFWGWLHPQPYALVITVLIALPWAAVAIIARSHGLFRVDERRNDPHPSVAIPLLFPGLVLWVRASDFNLLDWRVPVVAAFVVAGVLTAAAFGSDHTLKKRRATVALVFLLSIAYGFGAVSEANVLLDHSRAAVYRATVTGKSISTGRYTHYHVYLNAWGPHQYPDDVEVSQGSYGIASAGDDACVSLRQGVLHMPWYTVTFRGACKESCAGLTAPSAATFLEDLSTTTPTEWGT